MELVWLVPEAGEDLCLDLCATGVLNANAGFWIHCKFSWLSTINHAVSSADELRIIEELIHHIY